MANILNQFENIRNRFDEFQCEIGELKVEWNDVKGHDNRIKRYLKTISFAGKDYDVSDRFIHSLCSFFCFGRSIFNFFNPAEVLERLQMVEPHTVIRVVTFGSMCLAVSNPRKAYVDIDTLIRMLLKCVHRVEHMDYGDGVVTTIHRMDEEWAISGDKFSQIFRLRTPIDGYGQPTINLGLKRQASNSYLVADATAFKSKIKLGNGNYVGIPLMRAIETFNNEEGFQAMRQRLQVARLSPASLNETNTLYKAMRHAEKQSTKWWNLVHENLVRLYGRVDQKYGIATADAVSTKRARLLPMSCTVADLINFAIEVASKPRVELRPEPIYKWVGTMISNEYDLEGALEEEQSLSTDNYMDTLSQMDSPFIMNAGGNV